MTLHAADSRMPRMRSALRLILVLLGSAAAAPAASAAPAGTAVSAEPPATNAYQETVRVVDTSGVEPLTHPVAAIREVALRLREDVASEPNQREANQRSAPAVERGLFLVPKVIE